MRQSLTLKLFSMLLMFALLIAVIVGMTFWVTESQKADGLVINLAGRQRMLTQKLTKATLGYVIELREVDEARKQVELIVQTRSHLANAIAAAKQAGEFKLDQATLNFTPAAAARNIAADFSRGRELTLRQVTRRYRNPDNKPDAYEEKILALMEQDPQAWKQRDWFEKVVSGDHATMRYMRPLFVTQACMGCHGEASQVPQFVQDAYPEDLATGYQVGELRGAISVSWPTRAKKIEEHKAEAMAARALFSQTLNALRNGGTASFGDLNPEIPTCDDEAIRAQLNVVAGMWESFNQSIDVLFADNAQENPEFLAALNVVLTSNNTLLSEMNKAVGMFQARSDARTVLMSRVQYAALGLAVLALAASTYYLRRHITRPILQIVSGLREGAQQVDEAASQIATTSQGLADGASEQAGSVQVMHETLENISTMTHENADKAQRANQLSSRTRDAANVGAEALHKLNDAMAELNSSSGQIGQIVKVIEEIAFQTNLLALNASVEAARAGEHGKGFAIVADEVRNLAQRSAQAASETTSLIKNSVSRTQDGTHVAQEVGTALRGIVESISEVAGLIDEVAQATQLEADSVEQVTQNLTELDRNTHTNAAASEESAAAAEQLSAQSTSMKSIVEQLNILATGAANE